LPFEERLVDRSACLSLKPDGPLAELEGQREIMEEFAILRQRSAFTDYRLLITGY
jgi:hypothetical protein